MNDNGRRRKPSPSVDDRLERIERQLLILVKIGVHLMKANEQVLAFLGELNTYTNEIAADIDQLISDNAGLSPDVVAEMKAHSATLKAIAAKNDNPLPPPVEPPA